MAKDLDKIRLGNIEVKMGDAEVSLTIEQARELCALLKGLFGDDSTRIIHVGDYWYPRPWYAGPTWTYSGYDWTTGISCNALYTANNVSVEEVDKTYTMTFSLK